MTLPHRHLLSTLGGSLLFRLSLAVTACLGILGIGLISYAGHTTRHEAVDKARYRLQNAAQAQAMTIRQRLETAMDAARTMALALSAHRGDPLALNRDQANALLRRVLEDNPDFLGTYTLWEADAFDGRDRAFAGRPGQDPNGRLVPYWNRSPAGRIEVDPASGYDLPGIGDYYLLPRQSRRETLVEPYRYPVQGENVLMTSLVAPILDQGRFCGIAGVDLRVDFLQRIADSIDVYHGAGMVILMTNRGIIAGASGRPDAIGSPGGDSAHLAEYRRELDNPEGRIFERDGRLYAFTPITIGRTTTPWAVITMVPMAVITAEGDRPIRIMTLVGLAIIVLSTLLLIALLRYGFVKRVLALNAATQRLAGGDLSARCGVAGSDEISQLGRSFNQMAATMEESILGLRESRMLLSGVLENAFQMYGLLSPDGRLQIANRSALEMVGEPLEALQGKLLWELPWWRHDPAEQERVRQAVQEAGQGTFARFVTSHQDRAGDLHWIDFSLSPLHDEQQRLTFLIVEGRDITSHRQAEEEHLKVLNQLHHSQKMEAIGQLAGGIAHDFNNALGGIMGASEVLLQEQASPEDRRKFLQLILTAGRRAADLVSKLLTFSRHNTKASTPVDLGLVVQETLAILQRTLDKRIEISFSDTAQNTQVIGDGSMLQHMFLNMGINASHAMDGPGQLGFKVRNLDLDRSYCDASPFDLEPGPYVEVEVRDSGCGMTPEVQRRIFEPFFTTKGPGKGTGLGLAAAYGTVQEHHGAITVYSEVGNGTVFRVYLPVSGPAAQAAPEDLPALPGNATILLIDDEEIIRITAQKMLEDLGYRVLLAEDGRSGLELFRTSPERIDLVILDMIMPVQGGRETFAQLRLLAPDVPVILSSGFSKDEDLAEMKRNGLAGFITKPFRIVDLSLLINQVLESGR